MGEHNYHDYNEVLKTNKEAIYLSETTASIKSRIKAHLIDRIICILLLAPFLIWAYIKNDQGSYIFVLSLIFILISTILYVLIPIKLKGKTLGKLICGLRYISVGGEYAESGQHIGRGLIYVLLPIFEIVYGYYITIVVIVFWIISLIYLSKNRYHQAIHDKYSSCYVVYENKYQDYLNQL